MCSHQLLAGGGVAAVLLFAAVALAAPFNAAVLPEGWFYNGDVARAPNFAINEVRKT